MCFDDDSHPPMPLSNGSTARGEDVALQAADGSEVKAFLATSGGPVVWQVVILPDVRGLHDFYRELALRFADVGTRAIVVDYFARSAPDDMRDDSFDYMPHVEQMTTDHVPAGPRGRRRASSGRRGNGRADVYRRILYGGFTVLLRRDTGTWATGSHRILCRADSLPGRGDSGAGIRGAY